MSIREFMALFTVYWMQVLKHKTLTPPMITHDPPPRHFAGEDDKEEIVHFHAEKKLFCAIDSSLFIGFEKPL